MERLIQIALDHLPIGPHSLQHGGRGRPRRREQGFDKAPRLLCIQLNLIALLDDLASRFTAVGNDKCGHGATLNRGRFLEKLFVLVRHAGDKSLALSLLYRRFHGRNVCPGGTHCKR